MLLKNIPVSPGELPQLMEVPHHQHPEVFRKELMVLSTMPFLILLAGPTVLYAFGLWGWGSMALVLLIILYGFTLIVIRKSFSIRSYALRERDISYRKGWIFFSHITVPFDRVQHSEISQGPVDRYFGLVTLHVYTAGGSSSDLSIPGLPRDEAQRLRDFISRYHD